VESGPLRQIWIERRTSALTCRRWTRSSVEDCMLCIARIVDGFEESKVDGVGAGFGYEAAVFLDDTMCPREHV
jgi:hypothetical protein